MVAIMVGVKNYQPRWTGEGGTVVVRLLNTVVSLAAEKEKSDVSSLISISVFIRIKIGCLEKKNPQSEGSHQSLSEVRSSKPKIVTI